MKLKQLNSDFKKGKINKSDYINEMYSIHSLLFDYSEYIIDTNISSIEIKDNQVITTFRDSNIKFICVKGDKRLAPLDTLNFNQYEKSEMEMQNRLIKDGDIIFDIGANLGWYSLHISKNNPNSKIYAFEPVPRTFDYLNSNIQINNLKNIRTYQLGLSDEEGQFELYFDPFLSVNASLQNVAQIPENQTVSCRISTVDIFMEKNGISKLDFIKCDIEGAELLAFKGATNALKKYKPIIFCEMLRKWAAKFNYHPNDIINFLKNYGYICTVISGSELIEIKQVDEQTVDTNFIFLNIDNSAELIKNIVSPI